MPVAFNVPKLPAAVDPAQASPDDPLYKTILRKTASALGLDDPASQAMQAAMGGGIGAPLVSIFPNVEARLEGNAVANKAASKLPQVFQQGWEKFAQAYPRIAAHIKPEYVNPVTQAMEGPRWGSSAALGAPNGKVTQPMSLLITRAARNAVESDPNLANSVFMHEGTHAAQALGNSNSGRLYDLAEHLVGYDNNPFEISAYRAESPNLAHAPVGPALQSLSQGSSPAAQNMAKILADRVAKGWTPTP